MLSFLPTWVWFLPEAAVSTNFGEWYMRFLPFVVVCGAIAAGCIGAAAIIRSHER